MKNTFFNKLILSLIITLTLGQATMLTPTYAQATVASVCEGSYDPDSPTPYAIVCPVIKVLNVLILFGGAIFLGMVFLTGYKYSMAWGDPKGIQGAHNTATFAVVGLLLVVGIFTILRIIGTIFSIDTSFTSPQGPFEKLLQALEDLLNFANIAAP